MKLQIRKSGGTSRFIKISLNSEAYFQASVVENLKLGYSCTYP
jgi:hypothetical protein